MKTKPIPTVKQYRPTLREESKLSWGEAQELAAFLAKRHGMATPSFCIVCGVTPAPYLDLQRGGMVCAAHKPERGQA